MQKPLRQGKDRIIAGVCSGIAKYQNADVKAIRVLWAVLTVFTGLIPGTVAYGLCWAFIKPQSS